MQKFSYHIKITYPDGTKEYSSFIKTEKEYQLLLLCLGKKNKVELLVKNLLPNQ